MCALENCNENRNPYKHCDIIYMLVLHICFTLYTYYIFTKNL